MPEWMTESIFEDARIGILEEADKSKNKLMKIAGVAGRAGIVNRNKRFYSLLTFENAVERAQAKLKANKFLGEVEHPDSPRGSLKRAALRFTNLFMDGDMMRFEAVVLPTPGGQILEGLLRGGVGVGVSTRGRASVSYDQMGGEDVTVIQPDLEFDGIDVVLEESNPFGKVSNFESKGGTPAMKTVEELRAAYAELVESIEQEAVTKAKAAFETEVKEANDTVIAEEVRKQTEAIKVEAVKEAMESDEVKALKATVESIRGLVAPAGSVNESLDADSKALLEAAESAKTQLEESVTNLTKELDEVKVERDALAQAKADAETAKAVAEAIDAKLSGERFAEAIRKNLEECKTVDEVEAAFARSKALVESLLESQGLNVPGNGTVASPKTPDEDEATARQRRLAGLA